MVALSAIRSSNSRISSSLPLHLVAIFVGATSGIGLYTLKAFTKYARWPRVYFIGRSQATGDCIVAECKELNPEGKFLFVRADVSLIKNVYKVCEDIKTKEETLNLLMMCQGTLVGRTGWLFTFSPVARYRG
jgi:NAD(P)-dependent dehydrogenase (short-subunit alcohol dehydrogenase family)